LEYKEVVVLLRPLLQALRRRLLQARSLIQVVEKRRNDEDLRERGRGRIE